MLKKILNNLFLLILPLLMLVGCDSGSNLQSYVNQVKQNVVTSKKKDNLPELVYPATIKYQANTLRIPFQDTRSFSGAPSVDKSVPLLAYPLNMLKFVGTLTQETTIFAYIIAPDDKIYQVKIGDRLGNHYGKIVSIGKDKIEISESDEAGSPANTRIVTLQLKETH